MGCTSSKKIVKNTVEPKAEPKPNAGPTDAVFEPVAEAANEVEASQAVDDTDQCGRSTHTEAATDKLKIEIMGATGMKFDCLPLCSAEVVGKHETLSKAVTTEVLQPNSSGSDQAVSWRLVIEELKGYHCGDSVLLSMYIAEASDRTPAQTLIGTATLHGEQLRKGINGEIPLNNTPGDCTAHVKIRTVLTRDSAGGPASDEAIVIPTAAPGGVLAAVIEDDETEKTKSTPGASGVEVEIDPKKTGGDSVSVTSASDVLRPSRPEESPSSTPVPLKEEPDDKVQSDQASNHDEDDDWCGFCGC